MRSTKRFSSAAMAAAILAVSGGVGALAWAQTQSQPGTPSQTPKQNDPGRTNPSQPGQTNPTQPGRTNPDNPGRTNPNQPRDNTPNQVNPNQPGNDPNRNNPNQVDPRLDPNNPNRVIIEDNDYDANTTRRGGLNRYPRPFAFESPEMEARFNDSSRRLLLLERRMDESNRDLMRRLGEARQLTGQAQINGLFDVMQEVLREHQQLHDYLVQARTGWSGDMELTPSGSNTTTLREMDRTRTNRPGESMRPTTDATPRTDPVQPANPR